MTILMVTAIYPTPERPHYGVFIRSQIEMLRQRGLPIKVFAMAGRSRKWVYPKGMVQLRQVLANTQVDLIHAHYSYAGMVARTQRQVPVVVSFMGCDLLGGVDDEGKRSLVSILDASAAQMLALSVDGVIVKSREMAGKIPRRDVHVIPNEVNFERFHPVDMAEARASLGLDPHKKYILFAANPAEGRKRYPFSKEVVDYLAQRDPSVELLVVYKEPQERLVLYMNACDALIFPSYQEGSPNIVKQAMACNLPIVATDVGDIREMIGGTEGCFVCDPEVSLFAERLETILRRGGRTQGREHIHYLHPSVITDKIITVYEEVLHRRGTLRPDQALIPSS